MKKLVPEDSILIPKNAQRVFCGVIFDVYQWEQELFDGTNATYEMVRRPDTVIILGILDDRVVMVDEWQAGRPNYLRFPGGRVEEGETWQAAAEREMLEETGLRFKNWRLINVAQVETKIEWFVAVYLAFGVAGQAPARHDPGEKIAVIQKSFDELKTTIREDGNLVLKHSKDFFDKIDSLDQLREWPAFRGREVDI